MTGEDFLQSKGIWNHQRIQQSVGYKDYDVAELLDEFLHIHSVVLQCEHLSKNNCPLNRPPNKEVEQKSDGIISPIIDRRELLEAFKKYSNEADNVLHIGDDDIEKFLASNSL